MKYDNALQRVCDFVNDKFEFNDSRDKRPIIYIDGGYGIGKSYLGYELLNKYKFGKKRTENDRKCIFKKVCNTNVKISLAGVNDISEVNKDLSKHLRACFSIIEKLLIYVVFPFSYLIKRLVTHLKEKDISFTLDMFLKVKCLFKKVVIVVDELDRKCDKLDLNSVFAFLYELANYKNVRVLVIGDTSGIINNNERLKAISYRDKVCKEIITITEPSSNAIEGKINKASFQNSRFLRINQVTNNIRVLDKTTSVMNVIGVDMSDKQKLAAKYVVLCYFTNKETGIFNKFENSYLNPVANEKKGNSTVLILQKYHFALHEYLSRQYIADFPLIYTLIADGTFNLRQIDDLNKIINAIVNLEKVELDKDFRAINNDESTTFKEVTNILNESATLFVSKVVVSEFTCDLLFIKNSQNLKGTVSSIGKYTYPIDLRAFIPNSYDVTSKSNRNFYESLCILS